MESYSTVDSIVRGALADIGENSISSKYQRFLHWALEGIMDWNFDSAQEVKTVKLEMNDIKQIEIPKDFVDWVKVGILCGDKIKTLSVSDNIPLIHDKDDCGNPKPFNKCDCSVNTIPDNCETYGGYHFHNFIDDNGSHLGGIYGHGGGYNENGYFTVIKTASPAVIQFSSDVNTTEI
jgi:hypothetical protein